MHTVQEWIGKTTKEMMDYMYHCRGTCVKCGKQAMNPYATLCRGHHSAFHKWQKKKDREDEIGQPKMSRIGRSR